MNKNVSNIRICVNFAISTLLTMGLVACGGGDGGGGSTAPTTPAAPTTPVAITTINAPTVASAAVSSSATISTAGGSLAGPVQTLGTVAPYMLGRINADATKQAQKFLSKPQFGAAFVDTTSCLISGTETFNAADDGTSLSITYNNCSDTAGEVVNGTLSLTNIISTATNLSATSSIDLSVADAGFPTVRLVGTYYFTTTSTSTGSTTTLAGTSFSIIDGSNVTTLANFSFTEIYTTVTDLYSTTSNYTLASTELGGSVTVMTELPIQQYGYRLYPFAGQFVVTGSNNTKIRVTIFGDETLIGNDVQIEIDANGDDFYEATILRDWSAL